MGRIPTQRLEDLYKNACKKGYAKSGPFELHIKNADIVLIHYGTVIYRSINGKVDIGGAYSKTDRDYINGIIYLTNGSGRAFMKDFNLYFEP